MLGTALTFAAMAPRGTIAAPSPIYFQACDGYGSPTATGDGMTAFASGLRGLWVPMGSAGTTRRYLPPIGAAGIAACDQALADARLPDRYWLRRASLLRARAIHALSAGDRAAAMRDLDAATAALREPDDPYVRRSMVAGITLVRAYLVRMGGDAAAAARMVAPLWAERPLNRQFGIGLFAVLGDEDVTVGDEPLVQAMARIEPRHLLGMYMGAFDRGDFARAATLADHMVVPKKIIDLDATGFETRLENGKSQGTMIAVMGDQYGMKAYALAAMGRSDAAQATLADAQARITALTPPPLEPPAAGVRESSRALVDRSINALHARSSVTAQQRLGVWRDLVALRNRIATEPEAAWQDAIVIEKLQSIGVARDLLTLAHQRSGNPVYAVHPMPPRPAPTPEESANGLKALFNALPHAEIAKRIPAFRSSGSFFGNGDGFRVKPGAVEGNIMVEFTGQDASAPVVEEMTLLRAATVARAAGKSGFVVVDRRDYERTVQHYLGTWSLPNGYTTQIEIELVDRAALPERYRDVPWRVLDTDRVLALLEPVYIQVPKAKP